MISNADRDAHVPSRVEVLQQCIDDPFDFANFLRIISQFCYRIKLVK